jgi:signal transduction histidine kinase
MYFLKMTIAMIKAKIAEIRTAPAAMSLMIFLNAFLKRQSGEFSSFFSEYLQFALLVIGTIFYIEFSRDFLEAKNKLPLINKILQLEKYLLMATLLSFTYLVYFTNNFILQEAIENGTKLFITTIAIVYIFFYFFNKNLLQIYISIGNLILLICAIISYCIHLELLSKNGIFDNSMVFLEIGLVGLLAVFLMGVAHKERNALIEMIQEQEALKKEWENKNYEIQIALLQSQQNERNRISMEMHDDLGAGITTIRLYSELAKNRMGKNVIPEIEKISSSANELINNMNSIIWTMSPENDTLHNMIAYLRNYGLSYFEDAGISYQINVDENIPDTTVNGEKRRNVFLAIKEILNNIIKHAQATAVKVNLKIESNYLVLTIHDNGIGIHPENFRKFGNGLKNIKKRMEDMQLEFTVENNNGTLVTIKNKLD